MLYNTRPWAKIKFWVKANQSFFPPYILLKIRIKLNLQFSQSLENIRRILFSCYYIIFYNKYRKNLNINSWSCDDKHRPIADYKSSCQNKSRCVLNFCCVDCRALSQCLERRFCFVKSSFFESGFPVKSRKQLKILSLFYQAIYMFVYKVKSYTIRLVVFLKIDKSSLLFLNPI